MCIRDRETPAGVTPAPPATMTEAWKELEKKLNKPILIILCLLYTSDAADERSSVDLGGRRIIKKKNNKTMSGVDEHKNIQQHKQQYQKR